jgi:hypothetical protein
VRRLALLLATGAMLTALAPTAPAAAATPVRACGLIQASVPYTARGKTDRWRVYVKGAASCQSAREVLDAVMHLKARPHEGSSEADSYFTFAGWLCPFGLMGEQTCELPSRLPNHPPIHAHAEALQCTGTQRGCPAHLPEAAL